MQQNKHSCPRVLCPCYKFNNRSGIYCFPVPEADNTILTFANPSDRKRFMKKHCYPSEEKYRCAIYRILFKENGGEG